jgi:exportin-T
MSSGYQWSGVSAAQVEEWVQQSNNPADSAQQWQATRNLQEWTASNVNVPAILLQLLTTSCGSNARPNTSTHREAVQFYALTTLGRLPLAPEERRHMRTFLLSQFSFLAANGSDSRSSTNTPSSPSAFLRNKAAMLLTQQILTDVPTGNWNTVEPDLLRLVGTDPLLFLKTVETLLEDFQTNETDKDSIRQVKDFLKGHLTPHDTNPTFLESLFSTVAQILSQSLSTNPSESKHAVILLAIQTVKGFFQWTELIFLGKESANRVLEQLLVCLQPQQPEEIQWTALQAWQEWITSDSVVSKERESSIQTATDPKLPVLTALLEKIHEYNLLPYTGESAYEIEVVIEVGKVVNTMGLEITHLWQQTASNGNADDSSVHTLFHQILDLFFRAFAYDDIDVSLAVLPLASKLAAVMSDEPAHDAKDSCNQLLRRHLPQTLNILYQQIKYPKDFSFDFIDDENAEEEQYREELGKLYVKLVRVAPTTCFQFVCEAAAQWLDRTNSSNTNDGCITMSNAPTPDLEATLRLLYKYCEGIRPTPGMKTAMKNQTFCALLVALHESPIANHGHFEILCWYYDVAVRYYPIFQHSNHTILLSRVLDAMTGARGLQHGHARVRSRCCYLLLRLVKAIAPLLRPFVETAVAGIQGLLTNTTLELRPDDTLYLFETIGLLLGKTGIDAPEQARYLTLVMTPHVRSIEKSLQDPRLLQDTEFFGDRLAQSIAALAHLSKGFSKPAQSIQLVLMETVNITQIILEALPNHEQVRNKTMVLLPRMIQCLGDQVLDKIPRFLYILIEHCNSEDVLFVSQIFNQLCIKFKEASVPVIDGALMPFLRKCYALVPATDDVAGTSDVPPHLRTEQLSIQKLTFVVLQHIVTHNASAVLMSPTNVGNLESVLRSMSDGAVYVTDPIVQKTCVKFFREWLEQLTNQNTELNRYRRGFLVFCGQTFLPGLLHVLLSPSFDHRDAMQARVVAELAGVLYGWASQVSDNDALELTSRIPALADNSNVAVALRAVGSAKDAETWLTQIFQSYKS